METDEIITLAHYLIGAAAEPCQAGEASVQVGATIGIAVCGPDDGDAGQILRAADLALYRAKETGRGTFRFFELEMDGEVRQRAALEADLKQAIRHAQIEPYFQPLVRLPRAGRPIFRSRSTSRLVKSRAKRFQRSCSKYLHNMVFRPPDWWSKLRKMPRSKTCLLPGMKMIDAILSLSNSLELPVTAEGIEDSVHAVWLSERGCEESQGYFFGRPMSADETHSYLAKQSPSTH